MKYLIVKEGGFLEIDFNKLFPSASVIINDFCHIWKKIVRETEIDISVSTALAEFKNLMIYEALDGSRSTVISNQNFDRGIEGALYVINFIHIIKTLGAKTCLIMIHTSYNRKRTKNDFKNVLIDIESGATLVKKYAIENNICCSCICLNENHELINLLKDVSDSTKAGKFYAYLLFDYNEEWVMNEKGQNIIKILPNIDVHIRHTKFQFSGGWIPGKMSRSVFLYSQNGTTFSNWESDEIVTLMALALLTKLLHSGELLTKTYATKKEIYQRYTSRELKLFNKVINLRENPKKLFMIGSPIGMYQFYY